MATADLPTVSRMALPPPLREAEASRAASAARRAEFARLQERASHWMECLPPVGDDLPPLEELHADRRLTGREEAAVFRQLHWLRRRASERLSALDAETATWEQLEQIAGWLDRSEALRNGLVTVFLKLGASVARPFVNSHHGMDELLSEAAVTLMRAVEMFDVERGFRFSTYATRAIQHNLHKVVSREFDRRTRYAASGQLDTTIDERRWTSPREHQLMEALGAVDRWMATLVERDRYILRSRFGLLAGHQPRTLQFLADELGISRERVRQIERRALARLRAVGAGQLESLIEPLLTGGTG